MAWARMLAYVTGTVNQELLLRDEYLATENRILWAQVKVRLLLSDAEKRTLADIDYRLVRGESGVNLRGLYDCGAIAFVMLVLKHSVIDTWS